MDRARELAVETGLNTWFAAEAGRGALEGGRSIAAGRQAKGQVQDIAPPPAESPMSGEVEESTQSQAPNIQTQPTPSGKDLRWDDVLRKPRQAQQETTPAQATPQPQAAAPVLTHPAGEVTGIDEATGLPIVRRTGAPESPAE